MCDATATSIQHHAATHAPISEGQPEWYERDVGSAKDRTLVPMYVQQYLPMRKGRQ